VRAALVLLAVVAAVAINVVLLGYAAQPSDRAGHLTPTATLPGVPSTGRAPTVRVETDGRDD
jgi:hypothetical protein